MNKIWTDEAEWWISNENHITSSSASYCIIRWHFIVSTPQMTWERPKSEATPSEPPSGGWLQYSWSLFKFSFFFNFLQKVWIIYLKLQNGAKVSWLTAELSVRQKNYHYHRLHCQITSAQSLASNASQNGTTLLYILPSFYTVGRGGDTLVIFIYQWSVTVCLHRQSFWLYSQMPIVAARGGGQLLGAVNLDTTPPHRTLSALVQDNRALRETNKMMTVWDLWDYQHHYLILHLWNTSQKPTLQLQLC